MNSTLTIARHFVPQDPKTGLSPLQEQLINHPARVRIAAAPTGAGKSYAFQRAVQQKDQRVLFVVPTRRLAQNLARSLQEDGGRDAKIAIWSGDESKRLREQEGILRIGARRVREIYALNYAKEGGEMIIAIPESLNNVLLRNALYAQQAETGILDMLSNFDHIVFDEFHTIEARGFGLAAIFAALAAQGMGRANVSFLSATPLDIAPVLAKLELPEGAVVQLKERFSEQGRAVHGDVLLRFEEQVSLAALAQCHCAAIAKEIKQGWQVVMIYNSLSDLQNQLPALEQMVVQAGVAPADCLLINSLDDSRAAGNVQCGFTVGRAHSPEKFKILIATASVEVGVTFRANLLLMEPGFLPLNFLQRYGRAARGPYPGQVIVRWDQALKGRANWLRRLLKWASKHNGQTISIDEISNALTRQTQKSFQDCPEEVNYFGKLPNRAAYAAGLYWHVLMGHKSQNRYIKAHLQQHKPKPAKTIAAWLFALRDLEQDPQFSEAAQCWRTGFEQQARVLRDIGTRIRVVEANGHCFEQTETWLQRETEILERGLLSYGKDDQEEIHINGILRDYFREKKHYTPPQCCARFPHTAEIAIIKDDIMRVEAWCSLLQDTRGTASIAWELYPKAMQAAENLVRLTGLIVSEEQSVETNVAVL